jgi:hypothetical protein
MLLRISFSQQHQRKCRYIFAAPSDAITVIQPGFTEIFMRSMHRVCESELMGIGGDLRKASLPMIGCALSPRSCGGAVATDARGNSS